MEFLVLIYPNFFPKDSFMKTKQITQLLFSFALMVASFQAITCLGAEASQSSSTTMSSDAGGTNKNDSSMSSDQSSSQMTKGGQDASQPSNDDNQFVWWNPISWYKWTKAKLGF